MHRDEVRRALRLVRSVYLRDRLKLSGSARYECACGMSLKVGFGHSVIPLELLAAEAHPFGIPAPKEIPCPYCDSQAIYSLGSFDRSDEDVSLERPYLRIPSRRAIPDLLERSVFEAQFVDPSPRR